MNKEVRILVVDDEMIVREALSNYLRELYQWPGVADTVNMVHIKRHYYYSHTELNPSRIIPKGPDLDFESPHDREKFS